MNLKNKISNKRIAITGIGPLCSIGAGAQQLWAAILKQKTNVTLMPFNLEGDSWGSFYQHAINEFDILKFPNIDKRILDWIRDWKKKVEDHDLLYLFAVVGLALEDSGLKYSRENNDVGLVLTHENPGLELFFDSIANASFEYFNKGDFKAATIQANKKDFLTSVYGKCERLGYDSQTFMYLYFVSKMFSTHGFSLFVNNACASGLYAIEVASQQILLGRCSSMIVAGIDIQKTIYKHLWFKNIGLYAEDGLIKPFSEHRNGFVFGEGGAALVLEDYESAQKRGARIYAEYLGGDFSLEGDKVTLPSVASNFYAASIENAISGTSLSTKDIDLIVPHGIGTSITDLHEARAISKAFRNDGKQALVTAFKPYFGHNLGSCALLETSLLLLSMVNSYIPATLNCEPIDPKIHLNIVKNPIKRDIKTAMKLACGFAGYNGVSVFRR